MIDYKKHQDALLSRATRVYKDPALTDRVKKAFYDIPRHEFVTIYRQYTKDEWITVDDNNLHEHMEELYQDYPLVIFGTQDDFKKKVGTSFVSTISQPSFVLKMIDMLKLEEGHKVYELGGGSGWNAALMGHMVGPSGKIISVEIIPELVERANKCIARKGLEHVVIKQGEGGDGSDNEAPYDRAVFTAGAFDLPKTFFTQIKEGGLLLFVLKNKGGGDSLLLLEKKKDYFEAIDSMSCGFVPVTGKYHVENMEAIQLKNIIDDMKLKEIENIPFWWAGCKDQQSFVWKTHSIRSYLTITEPLYESIEFENGDTGFGIIDRKNKSAMIAHYNKLVCYGSTTAKDHFFSKMNEWIQVGMPAISNLKVRAFRLEDTIQPQNGEWIIKRKESQFLWSINN